METMIMAKSNKIKEIEHTLQRQTEVIQKQTKVKEQQTNTNPSRLQQRTSDHIAKEMRPKWMVEAHSTIYTTEHLVHHLD